jgi:hypothetical protein
MGASKIPFECKSLNWGFTMPRGRKFHFQFCDLINQEPTQIGPHPNPWSQQLNTKEVKNLQKPQSNLHKHLLWHLRIIGEKGILQCLHKIRVNVKIILSGATGTFRAQFSTGARETGWNWEMRDLFVGSFYQAHFMRINFGINLLAPSKPSFSWKQ